MRRAGRAIYILEQTLPDFFQVGLVSSIDPTRPDIVHVPLADSGSVESIYSPAIRLTYTPPAPLPPPLPRTLALEGEYVGAEVTSPTSVHRASAVPRILRLYPPYNEDTLLGPARRDAAAGGAHAPGHVKSTS